MEIFAWGANSHGQLGLGTCNELELPQIVPLSEPLVLSGAGGGGHTILVSTDGELYVSGWNSKGQLGIGTTEDVNKFQKLEFEQKFVSAEAGWDSSAALTVDHRLFVWGSNIHNQLGFSKKQYNIICRPTELKLPNDEQASSVKFGLRHMVILTKRNHILICGSLKHFKQNSKHQIINHNSTEFLLIVPSGKIHHIASGQHHIIFDSDRNSIQAVGDNKFMQCNETHPGGKIIQLSSGWTHSGFLTDSKQLYLYGRNNYGQLGNGSRAECVIPQKCQINPVEKFELGAEHGILLSKNDIYTWGWNEHGISGNGSVDDVLKPEKLNFMNDSEKLSIINIFAGSSFCMVLCRKKQP